jgi:hypothetical protein
MASLDAAEAALRLAWGHFRPAPASGATCAASASRYAASSASGIVASVVRKPCRKASTRCSTSGGCSTLDCTEKTKPRTLHRGGGARARGHSAWW